MSSPETAVLASALLLLELAARPAAGVEVYFEQTTAARVAGAPSGPGVLSRVWYAGRRMRLEPGGAAGGPALILRLDRGKAYRLDPERKVAVELALERLRARAQMDLALAGELMGGAEAPARTTELPGDKVVAGYPCRGYRIAAGAASMDVYVSEAVPLGVDAFADFLEWSGAGRALGGMLAEMRHLRGFPLQTRSRIEVMGQVQETLSTVTRVGLGPFPPGLFEPPAGWRLEPEAPGEGP
ncbi:MAG: hypothetical protein DMF80_20285 [Acidobacteria bacterium]|nr:MAG: hypothetical protein DMF80_20285 [Acidobacteriota bacterium]